jgi:Protein of unknown function (DUF3467)
VAEPEQAQVRIEWPEESQWPQGGYANIILVNHTPWDFTIRFGHVVLPPNPPGGRMPEEGIRTAATPISQVTMPPQTLRQLALLLQQQVAKYTANYGEIGGGPPEEGIA